MIDLTPTTEESARLARYFSEQILKDVRKHRKTDDRALLVETLKIAALVRRDNPRIFARLLIALEQDETPLIMPEPAE